MLKLFAIRCLAFKNSISAVSNPIGPRRQTLPALDGIRALAILLVLWHHLYLVGLASHLDVGPDWLRALSAMAASGVFLFFPLSGFLLFLPYARALLARQPWPRTRQFYLRRALRILPVYLVALSFFQW